MYPIYKGKVQVITSKLNRLSWILLVGSVSNTPVKIGNPSCTDLLTWYLFSKISNNSIFVLNLLFYQSVKSFPNPSVVSYIFYQIFIFENKNKIYLFNPESHDFFTSEKLNPSHRGILLIVPLTYNIVRQSSRHI